MNKLLRWMILLNKRLYKKPAFIALLAVIPICILAFSIASRGDSGFLTIALAQEDPDNPVSSEIVSDLMGEESIIKYTVISSPSDAVDAVKNGKADAAWIFPEGLGEKLSSFANDFFDDKFVIAVERESNVLLRLTHEKLAISLFRYSARAYYLDFARDNLEELDSLSDEELMQYYENISITKDLFTFGNPVSTAENSKSGGSDYLTAPIRGFLGVLVVLCGMAAAMFSLQDDKTGTFSRVPERGRLYVSLGCIMIAVLNIAVIVTVSLALSGLSTGPIREICCILLYSACVSVFCLFLKLIFRSLRAYASVLPLFIIIMTAVCPVFFDLRSIGPLQHLFPPTYYINAAHDSRYIIYMAVYATLGTVMCIILDAVTKKLKR